MMTGRIDYVTPTQIAEATYQAGLQRRPRLKRPYRPCDADLLRSTARAAFAEFKLRELPPAERARAAADLASEVERLFPRAHMEVLALYPSTETKGLEREVLPCAYPRRRLTIDREVFELPFEVLAPAGWRGFVTGPAGAGSSPAPAAVLGFLERARAVDAVQLREFADVYVWPLHFKHREKHYPTWGQIADAWPRLAARIAAL